ncbi:unnamed protein product, partial [marine sediment metagenome]
MGDATSHTRKDRRVLEDIGVLHHHVHSRWRVYPQSVSTAGIQLDADAVADVFGN